MPSQTRARAAARAARIAVTAASGVARRQRLEEPAETVGIGGHRAEQRPAGRAHSHVGQTVTAQRDRDREVSSTLARIVIDRAGRHGASARDSAEPNPLTRAASSNNAAPAEEINDSPTDSRTRHQPPRLRFTYGVPSRSRTWTSTSPIFPSRTGTSVRHTPLYTPPA